MGLGKQAKTLNRTQIKMISEFLLKNRYGLRDQTIFYYSVKCGLRSKEISNLLNISVKSVEMKRYRLRLKMGIDHESSLFEFINNF